jgi:hypothetical protein
MYFNKVFMPYIVRELDQNSTWRCKLFLWRLNFELVWWRLNWIVESSNLEIFKCYCEWRWFGTYIHGVTSYKIVLLIRSALQFTPLLYIKYGLHFSELYFTISNKCLSLTTDFVTKPVSGVSKLYADNVLEEALDKSQNSIQLQV